MTIPHNQRSGSHNLRETYSSGIAYLTQKSTTTKAIVLLHDPASGLLLALNADLIDIDIVLISGGITAELKFYVGRKVIAAAIDRHVQVNASGDQP